MIELELLHGNDLDKVAHIDRSDVGTDVVESLEEIMETTRYGEEHSMKGHTYAIRYEDAVVGIILMGEGVPWSVDPKEVNGVPFYRIMNFIMDRRYRGRGLGGETMEKTIRSIFTEYGAHPILVGCQEDNQQALRFYQRHGFAMTDGRDEDDVFLIRYPK